MRENEGLEQITWRFGWVIGSGSLLIAFLSQPTLQKDP